MANSRSGDSVTDRIVRIISAFDGTHPSLPVAMLARRADLPLSTAHRLVGELLAHGLLQKQPGGDVRPGMRLWELASRSSAAGDLKQVAMPFMEDIQAVVRQHTQLSVLREDEVLFIERLSSRGSVLNHAKVAGRLPLHVSSSGMVMMAHSPRHVQEAYLARRAAGAPPGPASGPAPARGPAPAFAPVPPAAELRRQWALMRQYGAASLPGIIVPDTTGIAVPVFNAAGTALAAIGVVVPTGEENISATVPALMTAARGISRGLGVGPDDAGPHHERQAARPGFPIE